MSPHYKPQKNRSRVGGDESAEFPGSIRHSEWHQLCPDGWVIFSHSHIEQAAAEFEVGNLYINRNLTGAIVSRQPFGGFKLSGVGSKAGGPDYLLQFLEPRVITENIQRQGFAPIAGNE